MLKVKSISINYCLSHASSVDKPLDPVKGKVAAGIVAGIKVTGAVAGLAGAGVGIARTVETIES